MPALFLDSLKNNQTATANSFSVKHPQCFSALFTTKIPAKTDKTLFKFKPFGRPKTSISAGKHRFSSPNTYDEKKIHFFPKSTCKSLGNNT
jgi:hypothetical protein